MPEWGVQPKEEGFGETRRKHLCRSQSGHRNPWRMFETSHVVSGHNKRKGLHRETQLTQEKKCEENPRAIPLPQVKHSET